VERDVAHLGIDGGVLLLADRQTRDHLRERGTERAGERGDAPAARHCCGRRDGGDEPGERLAALYRPADAVLDDHLAAEVAELNVTRRRVEERDLGHEADNLAPGRRDAVRFGFHPHGVERAEERCLVDVDEVHRHLRLSVDLEAQRFDVAQPAGGAADRLRDGFRDLDVRSRAEVDVVRDEKRPRADRDRAGGRVNARRTEVGHTVRVPADLLAEAFELAAPHVGEVLAIRSRRGALVEEDRDLQLAPDTLAQGSREHDAVFHGRPLERDEGHDVGGAHSGVLAGMLVQVDVLARGADAGECRVDGAIDRDDEGDDATVV
jgi:hypothetical protein